MKNAFGKALWNVVLRIGFLGGAVCLAWWSGMLACYHLWAGSFVDEAAKSRHEVFSLWFMFLTFLAIAIVVWSIRGIYVTLLGYEREVGI